MIKTTSKLRTGLSISLAVSLLSGMGLAGASAADAKPIANDDYATVSNVPVLDNHSPDPNSDDDLVSPWVAGFEYDVLSNDTSAVGIDPTTLEFLVPNNTTEQWTKSAILSNNFGSDDGAIFVRDGKIAWIFNYNLGDLPALTYRWKDMNGTQTQATAHFTKVVSPDETPTATPDVATTKANKTVRVNVLANDTAGIETGRGRAGIFQNLEVQDPADGAWKNSINVSGVGTYVVGLDYESYNSNPLISGKKAERLDILTNDAWAYATLQKATQYIDFTPADGFVGDAPKLNYRFANGYMPQDSLPGNEAPAKTAVQLGDVSVHESVDSKGIKTNIIIVAQCDIDMTYTIPKKTKPMPGNESNTWTWTWTSVAELPWIQLADRGNSDVTERMDADVNVSLTNKVQSDEFVSEFKSTGQNNGTVGFSYTSDAENLQVLYTACGSFVNGQSASSTLAVSVPTETPDDSTIPKDPETPVETPGDSTIPQEDPQLPDNPVITDDGTTDDGWITDDGKTDDYVETSVVADGETPVLATTGTGSNVGVLAWFASLLAGMGGAIIFGRKLHKTAK